MGFEGDLPLPTVDRQWRRRQVRIPSSCSSGFVKHRRISLPVNPNSRRTCIKLPRGVHERVHRSSMIPHHSRKSVVLAGLRRERDLSAEVDAVRGGAAVRAEVAVRGVVIEGAGVGGVGVVGAGVGGASVRGVELLDGNSSEDDGAGGEGLGQELSSKFGPRDTPDTLPGECSGSGSVGAFFCSIF